MIEEKTPPDPHTHRNYNFSSSLYIEVAVALLSESNYYTYIEHKENYFYSRETNIYFRDSNNHYKLDVINKREKGMSVYVHGAYADEIDPNRASQLLDDIEARTKESIKSNGAYSDAKTALWWSLGFVVFVLFCNWTRNPPPFFINIIVLVICGAISVCAINETASHNPGKSWLAILSAILVVVAFLLSIVGAVA